MNAAVALINPKFPHNVGAALRACSIFGADTLRWTGQRVIDPRLEDGRSITRLPREERMKLYNNVDWGWGPDRVLDEFVAEGFTPVCVELLENAEGLPGFEHPEKAIYVFGPEDGSISRGVKTACHRFVTIPSASCLNLAAAVNVVLYDRIAKEALCRN